MSWIQKRLQNFLLWRRCKFVGIWVHTSIHLEEGRPSRVECNRAVLSCVCWWSRSMWAVETEASWSFHSLVIFPNTMSFHSSCHLHWLLLHTLRSLSSAKNYTPSATHLHSWSLKLELVIFKTFLLNLLTFSFPTSQQQPINKMRSKAFKLNYLSRDCNIRIRLFHFAWIAKRSYGALQSMDTLQVWSSIQKMNKLFW